MKIFKHSDDNSLYGLDGLTEDELIAMYSMCINYRAYIQSIIKIPDKALLVMAPGQNAATVRLNLKMQEKYCDDFIELWNSIINAGGTHSIKN